MSWGKRSRLLLKLREKARWHACREYVKGIEMATILIIDDFSFQQKRILEIISAAGHTALQALTGAQGLEMLEQQNPDVVICNLILPGMGGVELLRRLQKSESNIPVLILTADIQRSVRDECMELGARASLKSQPIQRNDWKPLLKMASCILKPIPSPP